MKNNILKKGPIIAIISLLIIATLVPTISGEDQFSYAMQDIAVFNGGMINDYTVTTSSDDTYEGIMETETKGKLSNRYSYLEHKWSFELTGSYTLIEFYIEAYHTSNDEGDDFVFAYSTNNVSFTDLVTVTKTIDDDIYQSASLPSTLSGTIYIRVKDLDQTKGKRVLDTIYIDHMYIEATPEPDITPPIISNVIATDNDNSWYNRSSSIEGGEVFIGRQRFSMSYDSIHEKTIVFGGASLEVGHLNDTWAYDYTENKWYNMSPDEEGGSLRRMMDHAMVYDASADLTVMFGGYFYLGDGIWNYSNDTWIYNYTANKWYNMSPEVVGGSLKKRCGHRMTYDSTAKRIIMFGGYDGDNLLNETWVYDTVNNTWYNKTSEMIIIGDNFYPRAVMGLTYDSTAKKTIMFGGTASSVEFNDTWEYNFNTNTWTKLDTNVVGETLHPRFWHGMVYDAHTDLTIIFGGRNDLSNYPINETWVFTYQDKTWRKVNPSVSGGWLLTREALEMVYDSKAQQTIMLGGWHNHNEHGSDVLIFSNVTWAYDSADINAIITWTTDELSDSEVHYWIDEELGSIIANSNMVMSHKIVISYLEPGTTYYYEVRSTDGYGNVAVDNNSGAFYTFTTDRSPIITNVDATEVTHSTAVINWVTDEPSDSTIHYGDTVNLGNVTYDSELIFTHSFQLTYLEPETEYYYEVQSTDFSGKTTIDNNGGSYYTFNTTATPSNAMHVQSIDMWYYQQGKKFKLYTTVLIVDENDNSVENAMVYLSINSSIGSWTRLVYSSNDLTNSSGYVTFFYETKIKSLYIATVNDVVKEGWTYHPEDNVETSESIYVYEI